MTRRRLASAAVASIALGMVVGLLGGEPERVSVEIWLAVTTMWLAWAVLSELASIAAVRPDRLDAPWLPRRQQPPLDTRPRSLANIEGLLANACHSRRAAAIRLRPRLLDLVTELLRTRHGIDIHTDPERAKRVLGDVAWLIDEENELHRTPDAGDVQTLVARAMGEERATS